MVTLHEVYLVVKLLLDTAKSVVASRRSAVYLVVKLLTDTALYSLHRDGVFDGEITVRYSPRDYLQIQMCCIW